MKSDESLEGIFCGGREGICIRKRLERVGGQTLTEGMGDLLSPGLSPVKAQKVTICPRIRKRFGRSVDEAS